MGTISNRFYVTALADGTTISATLRTTATLTQMYSESSGVCVPNWTTDSASRPTIYAVTRMNGSYKVPTSADNVWSYNGVAITFDGNGNSTNFYDTVEGVNYPLFQKTTYTVSGYNMPALIILRNVAGRQGNTDQDVITLSGSVEISGSPLEFSVNIAVRVSTFAGSGFYGWLSGDSTITTQGGTATITSHLTNGTDTVSGYETEWFIEGNATAIQAKSTATTCTVTEAQVVDNATIRCDFYSDDEKVYAAYWDVDDLQDEDEMQITHGLSNQNNASLRESDGSVTFKIYMGKRTAPREVNTSYTSFKCKLLNSQSNTITTNLPGSATADSNGYFDITVNNLVIDGSLTVAKGGQVEITYTFAHNNGDTISGIVVAQ